MKTIPFCLTILFLGLLALPAAARAQSDIGLPERSQEAMVQQRVGVVDITIKYHRPLVNGRKIWGGLVPYGEVWRTGADANTTFETSEPIAVEGKTLAKGVYGLHTIPTADSWTIIFSKVSNAWGSYTYKQDEDALRVTVKPTAAPMEEAMEFSFEDLKADAATATLRWEKLAVPVRVTVSDEATVLPYLRQQLRGHAQYFWAPLNQAAQYCLTKNIALPEGLGWAEKSIQVEERFENLSTKADLLKAMGKTDEAAKVSQHALEVASPDQLYSSARLLQSQKREADAMKLLQAVAQRAPQTFMGHLAQARLKSAAGDFAGATAEVQQAQTAATSDDQKQSLNPLLKRLAEKQDINK